MWAVVSKELTNKCGRLKSLVVRSNGLLTLRSSRMFLTNYIMDKNNSYAGNVRTNPTAMKPAHMNITSHIWRSRPK